MRRVICTGGAGFIGSYVVRELLARGFAVTVVDDFRSGARDNLPCDGRVRLIERDIHDVDVELLEPDACGIVHLAAIASVQSSWDEPGSTQRTNLGCTLEVIGWARNLRNCRVVFASSAAVYGAQTVLPISEDARAAPMSPYGLHKLASETYLRLFASHYGFSAVSLRYFNVYGPGQLDRSDYAGVVSIFARAALDGATVTLYGGGEQTRDFIHVQDVARATAMALELPLGAGEHRSLNVGRQEAVSVAGLADAVGVACGRPLARVHGGSRAGDILHSVADTRAAREALGFAPSVPLVEGIRDYLDWLQRQRSA